MPKNPHWSASLLILLASMIWGASFPALRFALDAGLSPLGLIAARFCIGATGLAILVALTRTPVDRKAWLRGGLIGLVLAGSYWFQTDGLRFTTSSKAAFITGLFVLFTPLISVLFGEAVRRRHMLGAALAVVGLFLLVRQPDQPMGGWTRGDSENLVSSVLFGVQIVLIGRFAGATPPLALAFVQIVVIAAVAVIAFLIAGEPVAALVSAGRTAWPAVLFLGLAATTLAFWIQCSTQAKLGATEAAVLFSLEPVFATLLAVSGWVPGVREQLGPVQWLGAGALVAAALWAERGPALFGLGSGKAKGALQRS